jgi:hypothetical protein
MKITLTDFQVEVLLGLLGEKVDNEYYAILKPIYEQLSLHTENE